MVYIVRCNNSMVTDFYLDTVARMFAFDNVEIQDFHYKACDKRDIVITATVRDFFNVYNRGYKNVVFWMQGLEPEESFLKHSSKPRKMVLDFLTKLAVTKSKGIIYVSDAMMNYIENKFKIDTHHKSFVMPCFNVDSYDGSFINHSNKYQKNTFAYVGSLSKWQCFEDIVAFYQKIEALYSDCELRVFTQSQAEAKQILDSHQIHHYTVDFVSPEKLTEKLADVKFGFVIRDDIAVNQVATPTKLSSYLSAGVIPIFSKCLKDFYQRTKDMQYIVAIDDKDDIPDNLIRFCSNTVNYSDICNEYKSMFETYYNPNYYVQNSQEWVTTVMEACND